MSELDFKFLDTVIVDEIEFLEKDLRRMVLNKYVKEKTGDHSEQNVDFEKKFKSMEKSRVKKPVPEFYFNVKTNRAIKKTTIDKDNGSKYVSNDEHHLVVPVADENILSEFIDWLNEKSGDLDMDEFNNHFEYVFQNIIESIGVPPEEVQRDEPPAEEDYPPTEEDEPPAEMELGEEKVQEDEPPTDSFEDFDDFEQPEIPKPRRSRLARPIRDGDKDEVVKQSRPASRNIPSNDRIRGRGRRR